MEDEVVFVGAPRLSRQKPGLRGTLEAKRALTSVKEAPKALRHVVRCVRVPCEPSALQAGANPVQPPYNSLPFLPELAGAPSRA